MNRRTVLVGIACIAGTIVAALLVLGLAWVVINFYQVVKLMG